MRQYQRQTNTELALDLHETCIKLPSYLHNFNVRGKTHSHLLSFAVLRFALLRYGPFPDINCVVYTNAKNEANLV